jgi:hypothetical protein
MLSRPDHTFPVQTRDHKGGRIDIHPYMLAYEVYSHVYGPQKALVEGTCRGGFSTCELIAFLYARSFPQEEWAQRVNEVFDNSENC